MKKSTRNFLIALVIVISVATLGYIGKTIVDGEGFEIFKNNDNETESTIIQENSDENSLTVEKFTEILSKEGYEVTDESELIGNGSVLSMTFATNNDGSYRFEHVLYPTAEISKRTFNNRTQKIIEDYKKIDIEENPNFKSGENFDKFELEIDGRYYIVYRLGNTVLQTNAPIEKKNDIVRIIGDFK